jgi:hypothetical protein
MTMFCTYFGCAPVFTSQQMLALALVGGLFIAIRGIFWIVDALVDRVL